MRGRVKILEKILLPPDGSELAEAALAYLLNRAGLWEAEKVMLAVDCPVFLIKRTARHAGMEYPV